MNAAHIYKQKRLLCHYCGVEPGTTTDHIVPAHLGGPNVMWNYQPSCPRCNNLKKSNWPTCDCEKCAEAVRLFLQNPEWTDRAQEALASRKQHAQENLDYMIEFKLPMLQKKRRDAEAEAEMVEKLVLTARNPHTSIV